MIFLKTVLRISFTLEFYLDNLCSNKWKSKQFIYQKFKKQKIKTCFESKQNVKCE